MSNIQKPIVLLILDGWGLSPSWGGNAIAMSNPPFINSLWRDYPRLILQAFRRIAGPGGKVSSSEVGHGSIGCGRLIYQDLSRINEAIQNGTFYENDVLLKACRFVKKQNSSLHIIGMLSDGSIHSHINHLFALLELAKRKGIQKVFIHCFIDGRDSPTTSGLIYLTRLETEIRKLGIGKVSTLIGRYFAMDRDAHWDRTARCYQALTKGKALKEESPLHAISEVYKRGFTDEFIPPIIIATGPRGSVMPEQLIKNNDAVIFFNFRADRARQLTRAFTDKDFRPIWCFRKPKIFFVTLTLYQSGLPVSVAFPPPEIKNSLTQVLSQNKLKQLHIAESEKYAHVTYFFNGGKEGAYPKEDRLIIASPRVDSFDKTPKMKVEEITDAILKRLKKYDFIVANIANVDMVGHTGNIIAVSEAIKATDLAVEQITTSVLNLGGAVIITSDHGNAEQMVHLKEEGDPETLHTLNPVPFILITPNNKIKREGFTSEFSSKNILKDILVSKYTLADIAPTILEFMKIEKPTEMTGNSLLKYLKAKRGKI